MLRPQVYFSIDTDPCQVLVLALDFSAAFTLRPKAVFLTDFTFEDTSSLRPHVVVLCIIDSLIIDLACAIFLIEFDTILDLCYIDNFVCFRIARARLLRRDVLAHGL